MKREEAIACLKQHEPELKQLGIKRLLRFGSVARNEAREDSDVDLFFDSQKGRLDLFDLMDIKGAQALSLAAAPYPPQWGEQGGGTTRK